VVVSATVFLPRFSLAQFTVVEENGGITIARYTGSDTVVTVPETINGLPVRAIESPGFKETPVTTVQLPANLRNIGLESFRGCTNLETINIPNGVTNIGNFAFYNCQALTRLTIGKGVRRIGNSAFDRCHALQQVVIGTDLTSSLTHVDVYAFWDCPNLAAIYFYGNYPSFGDNLHSTSGAVPFHIYRYQSATGWPSQIQGHSVLSFIRLPTLVLTPTVRNVIHVAGTTTFLVTNTGTGTMRYQASESENWLSITTGAAGTNRGTVMVAFSNRTANSGRTGTVTVTSLDATNSPQLMRIIQTARPQLYWTPYIGNQQVSHLATSTSFSITNTQPGSIMPYTATTSDNWLSITSGGSGTNFGVIHISCLANPLAVARTGTVVVTAPGALDSPKNLTVTQPAKPVLVATPSQIQVPYTIAQATFSVSNARPGWSMSYTATSNAPWLRIASGATGTNSGNIVVAISANSEGSPRSGFLTVQAPGATDSPATLWVEQEAKPSLTVEPTEPTIGPEGGSLEFRITNAFGVYTASSSDDWLYLASGATGNDNGVLTVDVDANPTTTARTGTLVIEASNALGSPVTITIHQNSQAPLQVEPASHSVGPEPDTRPFMITHAFGPYEASTRDPWLHLVNGASGTNAGTLTVRFDLNPSLVSRTGTISVSATDAIGSPVTVRIHQAGDIMGISPPVRLFSSAKAIGTVISVWSADPWAVHPSAAWLSVPEYSTSANGGLVVDVEANPGNIRVGTLTVSNAAAQRIFRAGQWPAASIHLFTGAGDFDGDSRADLAVFHPETGIWDIHFREAGIRWPDVPLGDPGAIPVPADYDGDGIVDIATFNPASGEWRIWKSSTGKIDRRVFGQGGIPVPGNYEQEGSANLSVFFQEVGSWQYLRQNGAPSPLEDFGGAGTVPVPLYFESRTKMDWATYNPNSGEWLIALSAGIETIDLDAIGLPVPADYEGDGFSQPALFQPSSGHWIIRNPNGTVITNQLGGITSLPVPADYNGDGRDDLAVYDPESGAWQVLYSGTDEIVEFEHGGPGWIPVLNHAAKGRMPRNPEWSPPASPTYEEWKSQQFTPSELQDPDISAPEATSDPDQPDVANLLRYALGLDRFDDYAAVAPTSDRGIVYRHLRLRAQDGGIEYIIEATDDLEAPWIRALDVVEIDSVLSEDLQTESVGYQLPPIEHQRYLRLRIRMVD